MLAESAAAESLVHRLLGLIRRLPGGRLPETASAECRRIPAETGLVTAEPGLVTAERRLLRLLGRLRLEPTAAVSRRLGLHGRHGRFRRGGRRIQNLLPRLPLLAILCAHQIVRTNPVFRLIALEIVVGIRPVGPAIQLKKIFHIGLKGR